MATVENFEDNLVEKKKLKPQEIDGMWKICNVVNNWQQGDDMSLDRRWVFVRGDKGIRIPCCVSSNNELIELNSAELANDIGTFIKFKLGLLASQAKWTYKTQLNCANFVIERSSSCVQLDAVARIAWKDEPVWTFARMPFNRALTASDPRDGIKTHCPVFHEFLSRFESQKQADAYCAFIGSIILDRDNKTHKGVILYGEGRNGKSTQLNFIRHIFGKAVITKSSKKNDSFRTDGMEKARVVAFADVNNKDIFCDELVKSLIGGDNIEVNRKGQRQFQCRPLLKVIACTNVVPNIRDNVAEKRRWIFCDIAGFAGETDPQYQEKLNEEAEWILACCCDIYEQTKQGNEIPVDEDCLKAVTEAAEMDCEAFCAMHFEQDAGSKFLSRDIALLLNYTKSRVSHDRISKYLMKHYGAKQCRMGKEMYRGLAGVRIRQTSRMLIHCATSAEDISSS